MTPLSASAAQSLCTSGSRFPYNIPICRICKFADEKTLSPAKTFYAQNVYFVIHLVVFIHTSPAKSY